MQIFAASALALIVDALRDHAFHGEAGLRRIAAGGERLVFRAQEAGLGEAALRLGEHDVGRDEPFVSGVVALEERDHRAHAGVDTSWPPETRPVCMVYDAVSCAFTPCVMLRMSEYLSACLASSGSSSRDANAFDVGLDGVVERPAIVVAGLGLGIEGVEVRRAAPHPNLDDGFGFAGGSEQAGRRVPT